MSELLREVLDIAGYKEVEDTEQNVITCFLDYCDTGAFGDLEYDDAKEMINDGEITINDICKSLLKICK